MGRLASTGRRRFLTWAVAATATAIALPADAARRVVRPRSLAFYHLHTGESLNMVYWADGHYLPDATRHINWLLRDFRTDEVHPIDPRLLDLLAMLRNRLHTSEPFQVVCGYRSPQTNAMLASMSDGVAQNSFHLQGKAIDLRVPGRSLRQVHATALALHGGGVGYYPRSDFVHIDTGHVRHWRA